MSNLQITAKKPHLIIYFTFVYCCEKIWFSFIYLCGFKYLLRTHHEAWLILQPTHNIYLLI